VPGYLLFAAPLAGCCFFAVGAERCATVAVVAAPLAELAGWAMN
jgi:hypothetical protein